MRVEQNIDGVYQVVYTGNLAQNKAEAIQLINDDFKDEFKTRIFTSSLGYRIQNRRHDIHNDLQNINSLIIVGVAYYIDADNIPRSVTISNLETIRQEMVVDGLQRYQNKFAEISRVNNCETIEEVWE